MLNGPDREETSISLCGSHRYRCICIQPCVRKDDVVFR